MSFAPKTDWLGLGDGTNLKLKSNGDGATNGNLEIQGSNGDIIGNEVYGHVKAPTCEYVIAKKVTSFSKTIGKAHSTEYTNFALAGYTVSTGAGQEPTFSANGVQIEANTAKSTYCTYTPTGIEISPARHASTFGAISEFTESAELALQSGTYTVAANIDPSTINGDPVASDATGGKETVQLTFWTSSDEDAPDVTVNSDDGWRQTADWACTGSDSSMFSWTATFEKYLESEEA